MTFVEKAVAATVAVPVAVVVVVVVVAIAVVEAVAVASKVSAGRWAVRSGSRCGDGVKVYLRLWCSSKGLVTAFSDSTFRAVCRTLVA